MVKDAPSENSSLIPSTRKELIITSLLISRGLDLAKNISAFLYDGRRESLKMYLKEIRGIPLLSAVEEIRLAKRVRAGDKDAHNKMFRSNLRLVIKIAIKYMHLGMPLLYLIKEGNLGLMKAVDKFDARKGYRFSTYAARRIKQSIARSSVEHGKSAGFNNPIIVNSVAEEYEFISKRRCVCGGALKVAKQSFKPVPFEHDILTTKCEKCS
ncbi:MAG: sigma-70 family RNA polymerase sigma factor, partial [Candidatus Omnitrophota bacterium]